MATEDVIQDKGSNATDERSSQSSGKPSVPGFHSTPRVIPIVKEAQGTDGSAHGRVDFEFGEQHKLGDALTLRWSDGKSYLAYEKPFTLPNGLEVTYGQINGLGGDFYGTAHPISDGVGLDEQVRCFLAAWEWLAIDKTRNPGEAEQLLGVLQLEVNTINQALNTKVDPSVLYSRLSDQTLAFEEITITRPFDVPGYLGLARINYDHFGEDAHTAYTAGHTAALEVAQGGKPEDLPLAYAMNTHADHFLEDSFSAGHIRTPRRFLHNFLGDADICAKFMHDEDNAIGLQVKNSFCTTWTAYGDKRLLDKVDAANAQQCLLALQASVDEIFEAWRSKKSPPAGATYTALRYTPDLAAAQGEQALAPLFRPDGQRRSSVWDRRTHEFTDLYTFPSTIVAFEVGGWGSIRLRYEV
ncbi:hypothetical protein MMC26_006932 [Xylographa opegraphella]|nr:hypothetical protein [Xylographa opegraphella]